MRTRLTCLRNGQTVGMMLPERVFHQILALVDGWQVLRVDYGEAERNVTIRVAETPALWASQACPHCGRRQVSDGRHTSLTLRACAL